MLGSGRSLKEIKIASILEVTDLRKHFPVISGRVFSKQVGSIKAVDGVSFSIEEGQTLGLVGESGCGKTTVCKLILMLEDMTSGSIKFDGSRVEQMKKQETRKYKRSVQAVFQDPYSSLNPRMTVGQILREPLIVHKTMPKANFNDRVDELLENVGMTPDSKELYPHEFSGGQRQRIAIARSLALNPRLIVLDEPVSALDVSIRAQILSLMGDLQQKFGFTYLLIAHDLAVVEYFSDIIAVMYLGKIVEMALSEELSHKPRHPYTKALMAAIPQPDPDMPMSSEILSGEVPSALDPPSGCRFHPRCVDAILKCSEEEPFLRGVGDGHMLACFVN